jgi:hypothetical protein
VNPTTYKLRDTSAGLNGLSLPAGVDPSAFYRIWEATFTAGKEGTVFFTGEGATTSEMLLIGENEKVDPSIISFPRNVMLKVVKNLTANDDTFPISGQPAILEDQGPTILPVTANDTTVLTGVPFFIQSVTQPSGGGGTVSRRLSRRRWPLTKPHPRCHPCESRDPPIRPRRPRNGPQLSLG